MNEAVRGPEIKIAGCPMVRRPRGSLPVLQLEKPQMYKNNVIRLVFLVIILASAAGAYAQGSAGTGSTSTGIGPQTGPAGPGIRSGGWTQQPAAATNNTRTNTNLSPSQKNAMPPPNARGYQK
jgi:hypothetical protein